MPSTSEVGHAKNVANLQKLTEQVTVYTLYNPPVDNLKVANLQAIQRSSVDLPQPDGPSRVTNSPLAMLQLISLNTGVPE